MSFNTDAIVVNQVSKQFLMYKRPQDRLWQALFPKKKYANTFDALQNVSFTVKRGETVGIIGRNGSGKSTLLQMICGTLQPSSGHITVHGRVAALLELGAGFNPEFSGRENVYLNGAIMGLARSDIDSRMADILAFAEIGDFIDQPVKTYSSGMYVRLAFAIIAHVDADILIIDEALAVGDALFTQKCMRFLRKFKESGTILFVSHDSSAVINLCERSVWLHEGEMRAIGEAKDVCEDYLAMLFGAENQRGSSEPVKEMAPIPTISHWVDQRRHLINHSQLRNDLEVFRFDPEQSGFGEGAARIGNVYLSNTADEPLHWVVGGELVKLTVQVQVQGFLDRPIVGFYIKDRLGQTLFGDNTYLSYQHAPVAAHAGELLRATFEFPMPILPQGDYSIAVAIANGTQEEHTQHHWIHDALLFRSHASASATGLMGIPMKSIALTTSTTTETTSPTEPQQATESSAHKYQYDFDPTDNSTAARLCRLVGHDKAVLELGCAAGSMSKVLQRHYGCTITGIEYDAAAAELARPYCEEVHVADLEKTPASTLTSQQFDVVLMADVLEHLRDSAFHIRDVKQLLRPGGRLVMSVPNIAHNGILAQLWCGQFNYTDTGILDNTHVRFFTPHSLRALLEAAGLTIDHSDTVDTGPHHPEFAAYWQQLPDDLYTLLQHHTPGQAYQIIMCASKTESICN